MGIVNESKGTPKNLWEMVRLYDVSMYLKHNEGKSVVPERFIRTMKVKIFKKKTARNNLSYL